VFYRSGGRGPRTLSKVVSKVRCHIHDTSVHTTPDRPVVVSNCKLNSHANTCCLGANFRPILFTGKVCDVSTFLDTLPAQGNVEICSGATAYEDEQGVTHILIVNEALWMGDYLQHSLLNPYQIRASGLKLCDDPTDEEHLFGISAQTTQILFKMNGTTCLFKSRTPTLWELDNCQHIELTSDREWDPNEQMFGPENEINGPV